MCLHIVVALNCSSGRYTDAIPLLERSIEIPNIDEGQKHSLAKFTGCMQLGDTYSKCSETSKTQYFEFSPIIRRLLASVFSYQKLLNVFKSVKGVYNKIEKLRESKSGNYVNHPMAEIFAKSYLTSLLGFGNAAVSFTFNAYYKTHHQPLLPQFPPPIQPSSHCTTTVAPSSSINRVLGASCRRQGGRRHERNSLSIKFKFRVIRNCIEVMDFAYFVARSEISALPPYLATILSVPFSPQHPSHCRL
ncbi:hypothetical protein L2E82_48409 [Cichorium intybus]|uniref:Uncharacterized protein n=1 Tax=Cichorium intybus TaxID=13427 RepID=A0ACB8Z294_CICIN|nr:hypothetical protein L2E82_48409 [Cichorium intybus]